MGDEVGVERSEDVAHVAGGGREHHVGDDQDEEEEEDVMMLTSKENSFGMIDIWMELLL